ncbi:PAS and ANTAR domain-containing protein [Intrasporangium sp.]|uniref:PAS and ANTAR domain-containing protein n=1 Tax=Intrasporangium sp. TaxID=1925024 RepID=UPI00322210C6
MPKRSESTPHFTEASAPPVAACRYDAVGDRLWWSPQMYRLFGFEPGEVVPTLALVDAHIHPEDRLTVHGICCPAWQHGGPFTTRHRIHDSRGAVHDVLAVGESILTEGRCVTVHAYYVDVTTQIGADVRAGVTTALTETFRTRGLIDQVKGALMLAYGVDADTAFSLLRGISNNHNLRVAQLAAYVADRMARAEPGPEPAQETLFEILASVADRRALIESWAEPDGSVPDPPHPGGLDTERPPDTEGREPDGAGQGRSGPAGPPAG